tara:strand:+ start:501 stop:725 length:225 start_codon:yes stop_codon:yes gene_type:complete
MPTKFKADERVFIRGVAKNKLPVKRFYVKQMSKEALFEAINNDRTKPKVKQKCRNELVRRGVKIVRTQKVGGIC